MFSSKYRFVSVKIVFRLSLLRISRLPSRLKKHFLKACEQFNPERIFASIPIVFALKIIKELCELPCFQLFDERDALEQSIFPSQEYRIFGMNGHVSYL